MDYKKDLETLDVMLEQGLIEEEDYHEAVAGLKVHETRYATTEPSIEVEQGPAVGGAYRGFTKAVSLREYQEGWEEVKKEFPSDVPYNVARVLFNGLGNTFYKRGQDTIEIGSFMAFIAPEIKRLGLPTRAFTIYMDPIIKFLHTLGLIETVR